MPKYESLSTRQLSPLNQRKGEKIMTTFKSVPGIMTLDNLKPIIEDRRILFPVAVSHEYIEEDGFSFGCPVEHGHYTIIQYDFTMGVLTEDTIDMIQKTKRPERPNQGQAVEVYEFSQKDAWAWREGLDTTWAENEYHEWLAKGLVDDNESKEDFIDHRLESYWHWPMEWRQKCDDHFKALNSPEPAGEKKLVLKNGEFELYIDDNREYYFSTPYHHHGRLTKAVTSSALGYIEKYKTYLEALEDYKTKMSVINENIQLLKGTLSNHDK